MSEIVFQPLGNPVAAGEGLQHVADIDPRLTRTNYFDGRLLTAEDLTRDQIYLDQRLREAGRVLGTGIVRGLALSLDANTGMLRLTPGQAVTAAGRVLELGRQLTVNLGDRALISQLNDGQYRRFNRALYAVVLRYVDVGTDIAEVFPKDLGAKRGFQYALVTESVQLGLVPLPTPLAQQSPLQIRARLIREYLGDDSVRGLLPDDAIALGVLAIQDDRPQWLDAQLLRHPLRSEAGIGAVQTDLARHYESLLADVLASRRAGGLTGDFAATDYFSLLPPVGHLPSEAINPVSGRQGYFPENFKISIAPVRQSDVALLKAESMGLPPIDLSLGEPVDIMILAPLSNSVYGQYALQLERNLVDDSRLLPQLDLLRLKLYPPREVHQLPTDATVWQSIWNNIDTDQLFYLRRPTRAPETQISAIVLALGTGLPEGTEPIDSPADDGGFLEDENDVRLRWINFAWLADQRPPGDDDGEAASEALDNEFPGDAALVQIGLELLLLIPNRYDSVLWQTLLELARTDQLAPFLTALRASDSATPLGARVASIGAGMGLDSDLLDRWPPLDD